MPRKDIVPILIVGAGVGLLIQPILSNNLPASVHLTFAFRIGIFRVLTLFAPFALWIASLLAKMWKGVYQFGQFAAVGTLNSFIDIGVFNLETFLYSTSLIGTLLFAAFKAISFLCSTTNSFVWNSIGRSMPAARRASARRRDSTAWRSSDGC